MTTGTAIMIKCTNTTTIMTMIVIAMIIMEIDQSGFRAAFFTNLEMLFGRTAGEPVLPDVVFTDANFHQHLSHILYHRFGPRDIEERFF